MTLIVLILTTKLPDLIIIICLIIILAMFFLLIVIVECMVTRIILVVPVNVKNKMTRVDNIYIYICNIHLLRLFL